MKKFFKWLGIIIGSIILLIVIAIAAVLIRYDRYGLYPSGGPLSESQAKYDVIYYGINLEVMSEDQAIAGYVDIKLKSLTDNLNKIELDLIDNFDVLGLTDPDNHGLNFDHGGDKLMVNLVKPAGKDELIDLRIKYEGQPVEALMPPWIGGFNWSKDSTGADWIGLSCQGEGAKIWIPCKDHPSDEPDSVALSITIPKPYYCAANGVLREITEPKEGFQTYHWITHYPINNYDINISIGKYKVLQKYYYLENGDSMPVIFYHLAQSEAGAEKHLDMAIDMLKTYRKYYGEYPFAKEKFAIVETKYLGMEHQTINAYGNHYKYRKINGKDWDDLMVHEMGHEWWGNKVTANDWADLWIHEGICTFGEALYLREKGGEKAYHDHLQMIKKRISNKTPIIPKRNANSHEVYTGDIYSKGAWLMNSLRYILGDSAFFAALKDFATNPQYTYQNRVVTDNFIDLIKRHSQSDFSAYIADYLYTTNIPDVRVDSVSQNLYNVSIPNIDYTLPMDISGDEMYERVVLSKKPVQINSSVKPVVDPEDWYLKAGFKGLKNN